jgi:A/G-specific adenine glycosylase
VSRSAHDIAGFVDHVLCEGRERYRDFPWRHTRDPYAILVSEVMLQQTQVSRVVAYYETWMADFPSLEALAAAPLEAVLERWQGLGYNRRAIAMKRLAEKVVGDARAGKTHARLPATDAELRALPGVGPSTAAGVRAFAFGEPAAYLETNVRSVVLHELLPDVDEVPDREVRLLVEEAAQEAARRGVEPRVWNYALLDYGAYLKRAVPNPSRRSAHHARQSAFEGSRRQARAKLLRAVMAAPGLSAGDYGGTDIPAATELLEQLATEGFLTCEDGRWFVA